MEALRASSAAASVSPQPCQLPAASYERENARHREALTGTEAWGAPQQQYCKPALGVPGLHSLELTLMGCGNGACPVCLLALLP
ncbi:hypothetical protein P7K49_023136 [Saguinus oedipus]|uniref:Uncharacterized protein n=1 Tax=Saguinus oedipus TaxID=9490 RepID=A0ABQ9UKS3_SAGOE|nr:hypothetical protein P7K49_023136 [Saguinus oedipus]